MSDKVNSRYKILIFIPLTLGILIDNISFISNIYAEVYMFISIPFIAFWFWTGRLFARLSENKRKGFYFGNSLWLLSYIIFWMWINIPFPHLRNIITIFLEKFAQYYVIGVAPIILNISELIDIRFLIMTGSGVLSATYIFMFIVFSIGFCYELCKIRLIILIASFLIIGLPVISLLMPWTHRVKDSRILVKENSTEIKSSFSDYSKIGIEILFYFYIEKGKVYWEITNPKGAIIYAGYEIVENGNIYSEVTYPHNYPYKSKYQNIEEYHYIPNVFNIKPPGIPGKYTLTVKSYDAIGKFDVYWTDTPVPLI